MKTQIGQRIHLQEWIKKQNERLAEKKAKDNPYSLSNLLMLGCLGLLLVIIFIAFGGE